MVDNHGTDGDEMAAYLMQKRGGDAYPHNGTAHPVSEKTRLLLTPTPALTRRLAKERTPVGLYPAE